MLLKQSIDWKNEWFPIDDATYLNFAVHAAIPRVALNAVRLCGRREWGAFVAQVNSLRECAGASEETP